MKKETIYYFESAKIFGTIAGFLIIAATISASLGVKILELWDKGSNLGSPNFLIMWEILFWFCLVFGFICIIFTLYFWWKARNKSSINLTKK